MDPGRAVTVFTLEQNGRYGEGAIYEKTAAVASSVLPGFAPRVEEIFAGID